MISYAIKRLCLALAVALVVSIISFLLLRVSGDPAIAIAGEGARAEDIELVRRTYGLDRPLAVQYFDWLSRTVQGDFGQSLFFKMDVTALIGSKIQVTFVLALCAILLALAISLPLGVAAALSRGALIDRICSGAAILAQATPNFFLALGLIFLFAVKLRWVPVSGSDSWQNYILPSAALGIYAMPAFMRLVRSGMIDVLDSDYIRTARAYGLSPFSIVLKHALRNALAPVVALAAVQLGFLLGGSVVIEQIFALDGIGYLAYESIIHKDFPVTQTVVLLLSVIYVVLTLLADLANVWLDPRLRLGR
jgi:ABC-type dipeptide/oligopeptide/nickel transport system permease component